MDSDAAAGIAILGYLAVAVYAVFGAFSHNPYLAHDCRMYLLFGISGVVGAALLANDDGNVALRVLGFFLALGLFPAFYFFMTMFVADSVCTHHLGTFAAKCR